MFKKLGKDGGHKLLTKVDVQVDLDEEERNKSATKHREAMEGLVHMLDIRGRRDAYLEYKAKLRRDVDAFMLAHPDVTSKLAAQLAVLLSRKAVDAALRRALKKEPKR